MATKVKGEQIMQTPQWLQECPLDPIQPVGMKTVYIGESPKHIQMDDIGYGFWQARSVYVEVDEYFELG